LGRAPQGQGQAPKVRAFAVDGKKLDDLVAKAIG